MIHGHDRLTDGRSHVWDVDYETPRIKARYLVRQPAISRDDNPNVVNASLNIDAYQRLRQPSLDVRG
jgi:hypothetical protein